MRRIYLLLVLLTILLTGCEEARTTIMLKDFYNNSANNAYVAISKNLFRPGYDTAMQLTTTTVAPGSVVDIVLLDTDSLDSNAYYIYIALDFDGGGIGPSNDYIMPIPRVRIEEGKEVVLRDVEASINLAIKYDPATWGDSGIGRVFINNELTTPVSIQKPLGLVIRDTQDFSSSTLSDSESYIRISDDAVIEIAYFHEPYMNVFICLFMDRDISDTTEPFMPSIGDFASHNYSISNYNIMQYVDVGDYDYNRLYETLMDTVTVF